MGTNPGAQIPWRPSSQHPASIRALVSIAPETGCRPPIGYDPGLPWPPFLGALVAEHDIAAWLRNGGANLHLGEHFVVVDGDLRKPRLVGSWSNLFVSYVQCFQEWLFRMDDNGNMSCWRLGSFLVGCGTGESWLVPSFNEENMKT